MVYSLAVLPPVLAIFAPFQHVNHPEFHTSLSLLHFLSMKGEFVTGFPVPGDSAAFDVTEAAPVLIAIPTECDNSYLHVSVSLLTVSNFYPSERATDNISHDTLSFFLR